MKTLVRQPRGYRGIGQSVFAVPLVALILALSLTGCSHGRSAAAYCSVLKSGVADIQRNAASATAQAQSNPLGGLLTAVGGLGELDQLLGRLTSVAPDDIRDDVQTVHAVVHDQLKVSGGSIQDLLGSAASSIVNGLVHQQAFTRMDSYSQAHCGLNLFGSSATPSSQTASGTGTSTTLAATSTTLDVTANTDGPAPDLLPLPRHLDGSALGTGSPTSTTTGTGQPPTCSLNGTVVGLWGSLVAVNTISTLSICDLSSGRPGWSGPAGGGFDSKVAGMFSGVVVNVGVATTPQANSGVIQGGQAPGIPPAPLATVSGFDPRSATQLWPTEQLSSTTYSNPSARTIAAITASPTGSVLVTIDIRNDIYGSTNAIGVAAIEPATGSVIWQRQFLPADVGESDSMGNPSVTAYANVTALTIGNAKVLGLDPRTGKTLWQHKAGSTAFDVFALAPHQGQLTNRRSLYLQPATTPVLSYDGTDSRDWVVLDQATGSTLPMPTAGFAEMASLANGQDEVGFYQAPLGQLTVHDIEGLTPQWQYVAPAGEKIQTFGHIGHTLLVATDKELIGLDQAKRVKLWATPVTSDEANSMAADSGKVWANGNYLVIGGQAFRLVP